MISITLICYLRGNPEIWNLRTYVCLIAVQIYMFVDLEASEEARKIMTPCSEYLLLGEARQGHR